MPVSADHLTRFSSVVVSGAVMRIARGSASGTGDALSRGTREFLDRTPVISLGKPFTLEEVRRAVRWALGNIDPG